jgi:rhamnose transport system permease protein
MSETATRPADTSPAYTGVDTSRQPVWRPLVRWESALVVVLLAVLAFGSAQSDTFLSSTTFFFTGLNMGEIAIMALPLLLIIMVGEIDLSVASMLGLAGAVMGVLFEHGTPIALAMLAALGVGVVGGGLMGLLVARLGLPSIAVTIGGLTLFRGIAEIILPNPTTRTFPTGLADLGVLPIPGTQLAWSAACFIVLAIVCGVVLHATPLGRSLVAMGLQPEAAEFSGIRVRRITFWLYVLSGLVCAFAGILFTLKNASASYSAGSGLELTVVAVVLFGGVSIFGGRGTVLGVVLSVLIVGALQQAMTQLQVPAEVQNIVTGVLLLISVILPNGAEVWRRVVARTRRTAQSPAIAPPRDHPGGPDLP